MWRTVRRVAATVFLDDMVEVNRLTTTATMHWRFLDRTSGADSATIYWHFTVGDRVKIRLVDEMVSDHPMHHPFHLHGPRRFLVLARDGVPEANLVWKDTVLVRTGQVVDILFDVSNPGLWMAPLPHRRAPAERHDVQLQRRPWPAGGSGYGGSWSSLLGGRCAAAVRSSSPPGRRSRAT
jgi:Multicopper oxidase